MKEVIVHQVAKETCPVIVNAWHRNPIWTGICQWTKNFYKALQRLARGFEKAMDPMGAAVVEKRMQEIKLQHQLRYPCVPWL